MVGRSRFIASLDLSLFRFCTCSLILQLKGMYVKILKDK